MNVHFFVLVGALSACASEIDTSSGDLEAPGSTVVPSEFGGAEGTFSADEAAASLALLDQVTLPPETRAKYEEAIARGEASVVAVGPAAADLLVAGLLEDGNIEGAAAVDHYYLENRASEDSAVAFQTAIKIIVPLPAFCAVYGNRNCWDNTLCEGGLMQGLCGLLCECWVAV